MMMLWATAIDSAETVGHLTGNGLFGVFVLLLLVVGMEKVVSYRLAKDRLNAEQIRIEKNDAELVESRKIEADSRDKLSDALNGLAKVTAVNSEKIDQVQDDIQQIGNTLSEHSVKIERHEVDIDALKKRG